MPPRIPKLRRHSSGQGFVELNGRRLYLGRHDLPETRERYHRTVAQWIAAGRQPPAPAEPLTIVELIARYWAYAQEYYRHPDGSITGEVDAVKLALRPLKALYGRTAAAEFGPLALKAVRQRMISDGLCRTSINRHVGRIKRMFRWAAENELVQGTVHHALTAVAGLRKGRGTAKESTPVGPAPAGDVAAVRAHLSRQVVALIDLQLLTAARPGELVVMTPGDVDRSGSIWLYVPKRHKNAHRGHRRIIYLGPKAQAVLRPFLFGDAGAFCFSPAEAERERLAARREARTTPDSCGNVPGSNRKAWPRVKPGDGYTVASYRKAIRRVCERLGIAVWTPHQLRHNAATNLRRECDIETARVILGHRSSAVTEIYAEVDHARALDAMRRMG